MNNEIVNYTKYLFSAALKKSGNLEDAEELTQEVLLAALAFQGRGGEIGNMRSWLASTLNHKWCDLLRQKYKLPAISIDVVPEEAVEMEEDANGLTAEQVRREVAYLAGIYREVIVRHYLQGQKVQDIAEELKVPKGTVLSRLSYGREQMRKGLEMIEEYERQSYVPEHLELTCNGRSGLHGEPWSLVAEDLMKQNILIAAYEKPLTVTEIAKALGIPTAYIEKAVEGLIQSELMVQNKNKVYTNFMMKTPEQLLKALDEEIRVGEAWYVEIWHCMELLFDRLRSLEWFAGLGGHEKMCLEYYAMLEVFSGGIYRAARRIVDAQEVFPDRPDGGAWIARGNRYPMDFDFDNYRCGKYCYGGARRVYWENFLDSKSIALHVYDTQPDLNEYQHGPVELGDDDLCRLLYIIWRGISFEAVGFNLMCLEDIPHLAKYGILRYEKDIPKVAVPVLTKSQYEELAKVDKTYIMKLEDIMERPLREAFPRLKINIPKHLEGHVAEFRQYPCFSIPMVVIKKAISQGEFLKGVQEPTPPMVLVVEEGDTVSLATGK